MANPVQGVGRFATQSIRTADGGLVRSFRLALDEVYVREPQSGEGRNVEVGPASDVPGLLGEVDRIRRQTGLPPELVVYEEGVARNAFTRRAVTREVMLEAPSRQIAEQAAQEAGLVFRDAPAYAPGKYLFLADSSPDALAAFAALVDRSDVACTLLLARQQARKAMPNDSLINQQWHLKYNGQVGAVAGTDMNVEGAWAYPTVGGGRRGRGIRIGIVDDGLQTNHPDLAANVDTVNDKDWNGNDFDPSPGAGDDHGTACAGNAGAVGNNALGVAGAAPESTLVGMRLIADLVTDSQEAEAMAYLPAYIQVKSNSWGPYDDGITLEGPGSLTLAALKTAAETGRGGLGTIFAWAGGNGLQNNDNANYDGYANSIYTIAVGAFDSQSRQSYYSEPGANLVIVAPSSGSIPALGITTVDRTGPAGYATGDYTTSFGGTSSAAPTAAGVMALMLEANANLGWRDVQEILMRSAKQVNPSDTDWVTNGGGFHHNHKFGAGLIDATAAVNRSVGWTNLAAQVKRTVAQTGLSVAIPNQNTTGITRQFVVASADDVRVEHVTVKVSITHTARGNLKIVLTSPSGTASRLAEVHSDSGDNYAGWTFMTVRNWGESAVGTWSLTITDESSTGNTAGGTLTAATLEVFGVAASAPVNPPPTVTLTSPSTNIVVSPGATVNLSATASDLDQNGAAGVVSNVAFLANGVVLHTDTTAPYTHAWVPTAGVYSVTARATDSAGASTTTAAVQVQVANHVPVVTSAALSPSGIVYSDTAVAVTGIVASDVDGDALSFTYQWQFSLNGTTWADEAGLTTASLPPSTNFAGRLWRCAVRASDGLSLSDPFHAGSAAVRNRPATNAVVGTAYEYQPGLYVATSSASFGRQAVINEFSQGSNGGEWVELLTLQAGSLAGYRLQNAGSVILQFASGAAWSSIPAGTLVVIFNGSTAKDPLLPAGDTDPNDDGRMVLSSTNTTYFPRPRWPDLADGGDGIKLLDAAGATAAQVGYGSNTTLPPNVGTVGSGQAAHYAGDTEAGVQEASQWVATTAAAGGVTPGAGNGPANAAFVADLRSGVAGSSPLYRAGAGHQMPPGLSLDAATGLFGGVPTTAGTYTIVIERYNSLGETATETYQLVIAAAGPVEYSVWIAGFPGLSSTAPEADPEGDGTPNLIEYFMGLHPGETNASGIVAVAVPGAQVQMDYRRSKEITGVTWSAVWKSDLTSPAAWSDVGVSDAWLSDQGDYELRRATAPMLPGETQKFLRLRVTLP